MAGRRVDYLDTVGGIVARHVKVVSGRTVSRRRYCTKLPFCAYLRGIVKRRRAIVPDVGSGAGLGDRCMALARGKVFGC